MSNAVLFGNFPFEHVKRLAPGGKGRIGFRGIATGHKQGIGAQDGQQSHLVIRLVGEKMDNLAAVGHDVDRLIGKIVERQAGDALNGYGFAVGNGFERHGH